MKFMHLADLHLGRSLNGFSLLADQKYILDEILTICQDEQIETVLISGDIYDKTTPIGEAMVLFDDFLTALCALKTEIFIISGNHDSGKRLSFLHRLVDKLGIHLSPVFNGEISRNILTDQFGKINIYSLPFLKASSVKEFFPQRDIKTHHDALACVLESIELNQNERNILLSHQFVTGALASDQESAVGGAENIGIEIFEPFDYVALGHLHAPQKLKYDYIRYAGSPLKYSMAEIKQEKSVTIVDLGAKGELNIKTIPLTPLHDLRELKGSYDELTALSNYANTATDDYLKIILTDEEEIISALAKLRTIYPNIMELAYANKRSQKTEDSFSFSEQVLSRSPLELFGDLYQKQNNQPLSQEQEQYLSQVIEKLWEVDLCGR